MAYATGPGSNPVRVVVADLNSDGKPDILTADAAASTVGVLLNRGAGTFGPLRPYPTGPAQSLYGVSVADVNSDGKPDLMVTNTHAANVLLGNGNGTFQPMTPYATGVTGASLAIAAADLNSDGRPDLVTANNLSISVLLNATVLATQPDAVPPKLALWPNPVLSGAACTFEATGLPVQARQLEATLCNALGQTAWQACWPITPGSTHNELPTTELAPGIYLLRVQAYSAQGALIAPLPTQRLSVE